MCTVYRYLHILFMEIPEKYNVSEYADFHIQQVTLYAEFSPSRSLLSKTKQATSTSHLESSIATPEVVRSNINNTSSIANNKNHVISSTSTIYSNTKNPTNLPLLHPRTVPPEDTDLLKFLKFSNFIPLEVAWRECNKKRPPLHLELIYILVRM